MVNPVLNLLLKKSAFSTFKKTSPTLSYSLQLLLFSSFLITKVLEMNYFVFIGSVF